MNIFLIPKLLILQPKALFKSIDSYQKEIGIISMISIMIVAVKSLNVKASHHNFFEQSFLNSLLNTISNPQIFIVVTCLAHFLLVFVITKVCNRFFEPTEFKKILVSLMAISPIAIGGHVLFSLLRTTGGYTFVFPLKLACYLWVSFLTFTAIKTIAHASTKGALLVFIISIVPFVLFGWFSVISPYFLFL